jgi:hypothetical protein
VFLRTFETGDSPYSDAWEAVVRQVEIKPFSRWRVEREGLLVKGPAPAEESDDGNTSPVSV